LSKLHRESLAQGVVPHRLAGLVREVSEDDRVFVREGRRTVKRKVPDKRERQEACDGKEADGFPTRGWSLRIGFDADDCSRRL